MEGVGDLLFHFWQGKRKGEHGERGKGLRPGFKVSKCLKRIQHTGKVQTGAAPPAAEVRVWFN